MCKIRVIQKSKDSVITSRVVECEDITINPIDRPALAYYVEKDNWHALDYEFSTDKEEQCEYQTENLLLKYGINSGRFYQIYMKNEEIHQTDHFNIVRSIIRETSTERFKENIGNFEKLTNTIIKILCLDKS